MGHSEDDVVHKKPEADLRKRALSAANVWGSSVDLLGGALR